jgi:hypothetical protein
MLINDVRPSGVLREGPLLFDNLEYVIETVPSHAERKVPHRAVAGRVVLQATGRLFVLDQSGETRGFMLTIGKSPTRNSPDWLRMKFVFFKPTRY